MNYKIFDDRIIVPCKCGTRYCEKIFPTYEDSSNSTIYRHTKFKYKEYWYVYREPISHLYSALQTEMLSVWNGVEDVSMESLLDRFCQQGGTTHWSHNVCKKLHYHYSRNSKFVRLVELPELTPTLESLGYEVVNFNETDYDFKYYHIWYSKEECVQWVKDNFPEHWELLFASATEDVIYYEKLKKREKLSFNFI